MEKWICKVCGYTHQGMEAPERCPQCGAPKSKFYLYAKSHWNVYYVVLFILTLVVLFLTFFACRTSVTVDNTPVRTVELGRYLGKWYEVARYDHKFERGMEQCTAIYTMQQDGSITVVNQGVKDGKNKISVGKAKLTDDPGVLRVSFFGPFYSDYRILMLAPDYSYALVGGDQDGYLWILSRTPHLQKTSRDVLIQEARKRGYNPDKLIWVAQKSC